MNDTIEIYSLSEKLPKINTSVYIFSADLKTMATAVLSVITEERIQGLITGDLYWRRYNLRKRSPQWSSIEKFPYWTTGENIKKMIPREKEIESRSEILDL